MHETVPTNGIDLNVFVAGPAEGDPVIMLHGFPEFWFGWRHQIPRLVDAGYRVIVPDQRGYNRSDKPTGIEAYAIDEPMRDALGLLDYFGHDHARFVGHDWGAAVVWQLLMRHPERVNRAVTMNVPHPAVYERYLTRNPRQLLRSWYIFLIQLPRLPERLMGLGDWRVLRRFLASANRRDAFTESDLDRYREAWTQPGALTGMLNWYRAMVQVSVEEPPTQTIETPVLLLWGTQDPYMHSGMAAPSMQFCPSGRLERLETGTHWLHHEVPERVNANIVSFLN
ncbi:MAG: alpha/beta fold hydrolase [Salinirussus sp.]